MAALGSAAGLLVAGLTIGPDMLKKESRRQVSPAVSLPVNTSPVTPAAKVVATMEPAPIAAQSADVLPSQPPSEAVVRPEESTASQSPGEVSPPDAKTPAATHGDIPAYVSKSALEVGADVAVRRAQRCHPGGHAVGTATMFITFETNGVVSHARIEGEPLASAPVARCILEHARAIRIPKFAGAPFTFARKITMR